MSATKNSTSELRIAFKESNHELRLEVASDAASLSKEINSAIKEGELLNLTDTKGTTILVPGANIAFVEIGAAPERKVGFAN
jgi:hypothetical protein